MSAFRKHEEVLGGNRRRRGRRLGPSVASWLHRVLRHVVRSLASALEPTPRSRRTSASAAAVSDFMVAEPAFMEQVVEAAVSVRWTSTRPPDLGAFRFSFDVDGANVRERVVREVIEYVESYVEDGYPELGDCEYEMGGNVVVIVGLDGAGVRACMGPLRAMRNMLDEKYGFGLEWNTPAEDNAFLARLRPRA